MKQLNRIFLLTVLVFFLTSGMAKQVLLIQSDGDEYITSGDPLVIGAPYSSQVLRSPFSQDNLYRIWNHHLNGGPLQTLIFEKNFTTNCSNYLKLYIYVNDKSDVYINGFKFFHTPDCSQVYETFIVPQKVGLNTSGGVNTLRIVATNLGYQAGVYYQLGQEQCIPQIKAQYVFPQFNYLENPIVLIDSPLNWPWKKYGDYETLIPSLAKVLKLSASFSIISNRSNIRSKIKIWNKKVNEDELVYVLTSHQARSGEMQLRTSYEYVETFEIPADESQILYAILEEKFPDEDSRFVLEIIGYY